MVNKIFDCPILLPKTVKVTRVRHGKRSKEKLESRVVEGLDDLVSDLSIINFVDYTSELNQGITAYDRFEEQTDTLIRKLSMKSIDFIQVVGFPGSGRTTLVKHLANRINNGQVPPVLLDAKVFAIDVRILNSCDFSKTMSFIMQYYYETCATTKFIFLIKDLEYISLEAAAKIDSEVKMLKKLYKNELKLFKIIFNLEYTTYNESEELPNFPFWKSSEFIFFEEEQKPDKIVKILKPAINAYAEEHGVNISDNLLKMIAYMMFRKGNLSEYLRIDYEELLIKIEEVLVSAEIENKAKAKQEDVMKAFELDYKEYNLYSKKNKKAHAIHEAGHTVLSLVLSDLYDLLFVKVISDSLTHNAGTTYVRYKCIHYDEKDLVHSVAFKLGGRVAENLFGKTSNNGASSDLKSVNEEVMEYVSKCGFNERFGKNYATDFDSMSSKQFEILENETKRIVKQGQKFAEKTLKKHKKFVEILAKKLYKEGIVYGDDIKSMWKKYLKNMK